MFRSLTPVRSQSIPLPVDPFREWETMMERFFGARPDWWGTKSEDFLPRTNVAETATEYEVTIELPGMKPEDFTIEMKDGDLWLTGEKQEEHEESDKTFHRVERRYGRFQRVIPLPTMVEAERVQADYKDGVLHVRVPKTEAAKPHRIEVRS